jgi:ubiquinone/menaquinone biosynthesis C-methylase UbiE
MRIIRIILRSFVDCVRYVLSKPDERGDLTSDLFRLKIRNKVRQLINNNNGLLLDIGCGNRLLCENLFTKQNTLKVVGVDANHEMLKIANESFQKRKLHNLMHRNFMLITLRLRSV